MKKIFKPFLIISLVWSGCLGLHEAEKDKKSTDIIPPVLLNKTPLIYPEEARLNGLEGQVGLNIYVDANGDVRKIRIQSSSNNPQLDEAAEKYVSRFKFRPARKAEENIGIWVSFKIDFSLHDIDLNFDINTWLGEVSDLLSGPAKTDSGLSEQSEEKILSLYKQVNSFINRNPEKNFNRQIDQILSRTSREKWQEYYDLCPFTFILYFDLLKRFPGFNLIDKVRSLMMVTLEEDIERAAELSMKRIGGPQLFNKFTQTVQEFLNSEYDGEYPQSLDLILDHYRH